MESSTSTESWSLDKSFIAAAEATSDYSAAMNDLSNDKDSVEVDDSKTNKNERSSAQYPIKNVTMVIISN